MLRFGKVKIMKTEQKEKNEKMPFPSTVTSPCPNEMVRDLSREIVESEKDLGNTLSSAGNVHAFVLPHYTDVNTGTYGIESLILAILKNAGASFPKDIEQGEFRKVAINASLFASEIISQVQEIFTAGNSRYPYQTIHNCLATYLAKKGKVCKIYLTNQEDKPRPCCKPRVKFYVNESWTDNVCLPQA